MGFDFTLEEPKLPSLKRWRELKARFPKTSILRRLEYEKLTTLELNGTVLDLGGGAAAKYVELLKGDFSYTSANIDPDIAPTYLIEPGKGLPHEGDSVDCVITMNTLEHVYDDKYMLRELGRVLKPGGQLHISVPWMFRIHAHPDDYNRHTASWWAITLEECGFESATILPMVWGNKSTQSLVVGKTSAFAELRDILIAKTRHSGQKHYTGKAGRRVCSAALGYFITARAGTKSEPEGGLGG